MFCGGFPAVRTPRQVFPLGPGPITITSTHATATVAASISFDANPATFANFNQTSTGVALPLLRNFFDISGRGQVSLRIPWRCHGASTGNDGVLTVFVIRSSASPSMSVRLTFPTSQTVLSLPSSESIVSSPKEKLTIRERVVFNGGDGALYQCTDVILSSTYTGANVTCPNNLVGLSSTANATTTRVASASGTATSAAASATASPRSAAIGRQELSVVGAGLAGVSAMMLILL